MSRYVLLLLTLVHFGAALAPPRAHARCTTAQDMELFRTAVWREINCASRTLDFGATASCDGGLPSCAAAVRPAIADLVAGGAPPAAALGSPALAKQLRCQRAILRAASRYLGRRAKDILRGNRRTRSNGIAPQITTGCRGVAVAEPAPGSRLPTLGGACRGAVPAPGAVIDETRVARCLRSGLEAIAQQVAPEPLPPNVVLVLTDDQNLPSLQHMPGVLEHVAARAVSFDNAFVSTPICSPSRASLFTGRYAHRHGITGNFNAAAAFGDTPTVAGWLAAAGYRTALVGKYFNMTRALGTTVPPGWHDWYALIEEGVNKPGNGFYDYAINDNGVVVQRGSRPEDYSTDVLAKRVVSYIRANRKRPFFVQFSPYAPHGPFLAAPRHEFAFPLLEPWRPPNWREADVLLKPTWVRFMTRHLPPPKAGDELRRKQLASLLAVDEAVTRISDTLESLGLTDNTVLIFTSDHGFHWGEHWWNDKFTAYDESLRVPLLVRYPLLSPEPARRQEMIVNLDLPPTIAELAGATVPPGLDGQSFAPLLAGGSGGRADFMIGMWGAIIVPPWMGVRTERWKYIDLDVTQGIGEELYDLEADPYELANLAQDPAHAETLAALRQRLAELQAP